MKSLLFIEFFFQKLEQNNIRYVHWKSNLNLHNALLGHDDLDILVHPNDQKDIEDVFKQLNIIRGYSEKDIWQDGVFHYYGIDEETLQIVHIHLHYTLPVGYDYNKNFILPIVDNVIETRGKLHNVYVSSPEYEYIILVIRIMIKNALTPFLLSSPKTQIRLLRGGKIVSGYSLEEFNDLSEKINRKKLRAFLIDSLPFLEVEFFEICESVIIKNNSLIAFLKVANKLKKKLKPCRDKNEINSFLVSFYRLNRNRVRNFVNKIISNPIKGSKIPENGGRIYAFIGGDGAGKSTNISKLERNLSKTFKTTSIHIGKPPKSFLGAILYYISKSFNTFRLKSLSSNLMYLRLAIDRKRAFLKAEKYKKKGIIVILDRIPTEGITAMDSPQINKEKYPRLARFERNQYKVVKGVDLIFVMKLNPEVALQRRPDDNPDILRIRSGQVWDNTWNLSYQIVTDTGELNFKQVEKRILTNVWNNFNIPYKSFELIGVSGVGKSTITKLLKDELGSVKSVFSFLDYPVLTFQTSVKNLKGFKSLFFLNKENFNSRLSFNSFFQKLVISKVANENFKTFHSCIDQGVIYSLVICLKENIISEEEFIDSVNEIEYAFDFIVKLQGPKDLLFNRIKNRANKGFGRAKDMSFEEFGVFYEEYEKAFKILEKTNLKIIKIDSSQYSPDEIVTLIINRLHSK